MRLPRWTLTRALAVCVLVTSALVSAVVWSILEGWHRSILTGADALQESATRRATALVDGYLGQLRRAVSDVERRQAAGVCTLGDAAGARACLLGIAAADEAIAEITFTSPAGWQASAWRAGTGGAPCSGETRPRGAVFIAVSRCGNQVTERPMPDPREHLTYQTPAAPERLGRPIWSDLSYSALDDDRPEPERRVVVNILEGLPDGHGKFVGVLRVALLERQLDDAFLHLRVNERDEKDPFRVFLADGSGQLLTRAWPAARLMANADDDLRIAKDDVPPVVAAALAQPEDATTFSHGGQRWRISFADLDGTQGWRVGILGPEDYYLGGARRVQRLVTMTAAGVLFVVAMLLAWTAYTLRRGLRRVVIETGHMRALDFAPAAGPVTSGFADVESVLTGLEQAKTAVRALGKYAPVDLVRQLYHANREPTLGGELREVSLMFTDIKDFTSFAETLPPDRLARLLGHYFAAMSAAVSEHGGTIDKYIGDALMVLWNAPAACADHPTCACRAALACIEATARLFASPEWEGLPPLTTRFGIHLDEVMVGHYGAPSRFSYTALGDGVNLASRLEGLNKEYGTTIIVSERIVERARDGGFVFRLLDRVAVKGKSRAVAVYELLGDNVHTAVGHARRYEEALAAYAARDFAAAMKLVEPQLDDPPSQLLWRRCQELHASPPPPEWNGIHAWTSK